MAKIRNIPPFAPRQDEPDQYALELAERRGGGRLKVHFFNIHPEEYTFFEVNRTTITQTMGGIFLTDFGAGPPIITLRGVTGWGRYSVQTESGGQTQLYGQEIFLTRLQQLWRESRGGGPGRRAGYTGNFLQERTDRLNFEVRFLNFLDAEAWAVNIDEFRLRRSRTRPLLYQYEITMTGLFRLDDPNRGGLPEIEILRGITNRAQTIQAAIDSLRTNVSRLRVFADRIREFRATLEAPVFEVIDIATQGIRAFQSIVEETSALIEFPAVLVERVTLRVREIMGVLVLAGLILPEFMFALRRIECALRSVQPIDLLERVQRLSDLAGLAICSEVLSAAVTGGRLQESPLADAENVITQTNPIAARANIQKSERFEVDEIVVPLGALDAVGSLGAAAALGKAGDPGGRGPQSVGILGASAGGGGGGGTGELISGGRSELLGLTIAGGGVTVSGTSRVVGSRDITVTVEEPVQSVVGVFLAEDPERLQNFFASWAGRSVILTRLPPGPIVVVYTPVSEVLRTDVVPSVSLVRVSQGDTLQLLAAKFLGSVGRWPDLASLNSLEFPYIADTGFARELKASGEITATRVVGTTGDIIIPVGTLVAADLEFRTDTGKVIETLLYELIDNDLVILDGEDLSTGSVRALLPGIGSNISRGTITRFLSPISAIETVTNTEAITGGKVLRVLLVGELVKVPSSVGESIVTTALTPEQLLGVDIALETNGELGISTGGDLNLIGGIANMQQALSMRFSTELFELLLHTNYGTIVPSLLGTRLLPSTLKALDLEARTSLLADGRVQSVRSLTTEIDNDAVRVTALIDLVRDIQQAPVNIVVRG